MPHIPPTHRDKAFMPLREKLNGVVYVAVIGYSRDVLVSAKSDTEAASSVPDVVTRVIFYPVCDGKRYSVEEHITAKGFVRV